MPRTKRKSRTLDEAALRLSGMRSIDTTLHFAEGFNVAEYETRVQTLQSKLSTHNDLLIQIDATTAEIAALEKEMKTYSGRMLLYAAARYGKQSIQYMQAGGTIHKRSTKQSVQTPETQIITLPKSSMNVRVMAARN